MNVTRAVLATVLLAHLAPFALSQAVAWKEEKDPKGYTDYSARYSLFESPRRNTSSCQILITRDGTTMYVTATDVHYKFTEAHDPDQFEWEMGQTLEFTKKPDGTVDYKVGWGASRMGGLVDLFDPREHPDIFADKFAKYAKLLPQDVQERFAGHYDIGKALEKK
jgi:hypothetical protein